MEKEEIKKVLNRLIVNNSPEEISLELFEGKSIVENPVDNVNNSL